MKENARLQVRTTLMKFLLFLYLPAGPTKPPYLGLVTVSQGRKTKVVGKLRFAVGIILCGMAEALPHTCDITKGKLIECKLFKVNYVANENNFDTIFILLCRKRSSCGSVR